MYPSRFARGACAVLCVRVCVFVHWPPYYICVNIMSKLFVSCVVHNASLCFFDKTCHAKNGFHIIGSNA